MSYHQTYKSQVEIAVRVCHRLSELMYVTGYGGNLAWRLDDDLLLITPTQMNKGAIQPEDMVFINGAGDKHKGRRGSTSRNIALRRFRLEKRQRYSLGIFPTSCHVVKTEQ